MCSNGITAHMMLPTHAVLGLWLAVPLVALAPELAPAGLAGALVGSVAPDLDLYAGHRRTLHHPTGYLAAGLAVGSLAVVRPTPLAVAAAVALLAAALHCRMDRYGGGLELRPWRGTSERGVYDHVRGRWLAPKRWIRYDGAPEDALLAAVASAPLLVVLEGPFRWVVGAALVVGAVYVVLRRRLADAAPAVAGRLPEPVGSRLPRRYLE